MCAASSATGAPLALPCPLKRSFHHIAAVADLDHVLDLGAEVFERVVNRLLPAPDALVTAKPIS
jgi:hypothetical protein